MYWKEILDANRMLRKSLRHEMRINEKLLTNKHLSAMSAAYYLGKKDAYKDAVGRINDLISSYRIS